MDSAKETKAWREVQRKGKWADAFRGLHVLIKTTSSLRSQTIFAALAIALGFLFEISKFEWLVLILTIAFVFVTEAINTAIEIDIDLTSPEYHPFAKDTKDVAAAAVLLSAITAVIIGLVIFVPKILVLIF